MAPFLGSDLLRGEKVYLNRLQRSDCQHLADWWDDLEFQRYLRRSQIFPTTAEELEGWFFSAPDPADESYMLAIRTIDDQKFIGVCEFNRFFRQARHCMFWIAVGHPGYRGQGYGSDAVRVMLKFAFLEMNLNRVGLEVMSYNERAIRAYERIGFVHEGRQREVVVRDGIYYDILLMGILRREWEARYWQT